MSSQDDHTDETRVIGEEGARPPWRGAQAAPDEQPPAPAHGWQDEWPSGPGTVEPTGPSWPTVTLGLVCLAVAVAVLVVQTVDLTVDWRLAAPLALAGVGALVAVVGAVGVVLGTRR